MSLSLDTEETPRPIRAGDDPLALILAAHAIQRTRCGEIDRLVALGVADGPTVVRLQAYLTDDLPLHWQDEERDLFPRLRRRAAPEDAIGDALNRLAGDHDASAAVAVTLARALGAVGTGNVLDAETRATFRAFAERERRHFTFENAVVIPLARARLDAEDRRAILRGMAARRGLDLIPVH